MKNVAGARKLVDALMTSFDTAYRQRVFGRTLDEILIVYDIIAAGSDESMAIIKAHRRVIMTAVEAADAKVAWPTAHSIMTLALTHQVDQLLKE